MVAALSAAQGTVRWRRRFQPPGSWPETAAAPESMAVDPSGGAIYVSGFVRRRDQFGSGITLAYDARTGQELWRAVIRDPTGGVSYPVVSNALSPDGSVLYVAGSRLPWWDLSRMEVQVVAYEARTGRRLWMSHFARPGGWSGMWVVAAPDGKSVYVAATPAGKFLVLGLRASTGSLRWASSELQRENWVAGLGVSPDGQRVFATAPQETGNFITVAYAASSGAQLWTRFQPGNLMQYDALAVSPDGATVVVGGARNLGAAWGFTTVAFEAATGDLRWSSPFLGYQDEGGYAMPAISPDGTEVYIAGTATEYQHVTTVAYDLGTGERDWYAIYAEDSTGFADAIALSPDGGELYVAGGSKLIGSTTDLDMVVLAYPTG
jgi:outer membrane protein assembly factor BamB